MLPPRSLSRPQAQSANAVSAAARSALLCTAGISPRGEIPAVQRRALLAAALTAFALCACGRDNDLGGSISELFPLSFSRVEVYRNSEALQVSYYNTRGTDVDLVVRFTVGLADVALQDGDKLSLVGEYAP